MSNLNGRIIVPWLAFEGLPEETFMSNVNAIEKGMDGNPAFDSPPVPPAVFKAAVGAYTGSNAAALDGSKKAIEDRKKKREDVTLMLRLLGHYVETACNDDPAIFNTSGFIAVTRTKTAPAPLAGSSFQWIDRGPNSGEIAVKIAALIGAIAYELRYTLVANGVASGSPTTLTLTSPRKLILTGLTPTGTYQFQVRALGKLGFNDWSTPMTFICA